MTPTAAWPAPLTADDCVEIAIKQSARVKVAQADVAGARAQAAQIEGMLSPKLSLLTYVAPMFEAKGGIGLGAADSYTRDLSKWGPYAHADARLVKPLTTFGRYNAGVTAARERTAVEEERAREARNGVRVEVRRLYGLRLYALSMLPNLDNGKKILSEAIEKADKMYRDETGEVTLPELMKLRYGAGEIERFLRQARDGIELATMALKQAMGLRSSEPVEFADDKLSLPDDPVPTLPALQAAAQDSRPEVGQLRHGKAATAAWELAEKRANLPILFVAAIAQGDFTPMRPRGLSAVLYNSYNDYYGGVALGLKLDLDLAMASARAAEARAKASWVTANEALAETGIPLQVVKARQELLQHRDLASVAEEEVKNTRKWMTFAAAAWASGTGEAKDVLEGVAAHLMAKKAYYDHLLGALQARADLEQATGAP